MDTAGNFARCEQTGNHIAVGVNHLGVGVNLHAAHGVMDAGCHLDGVVGSLGKVMLHTGGTAKFLVLTGCHSIIPVRQGLCQHSRVNAQLLCQLLNGSTLGDNAVLNILFGGLQTFPQVLVEDNIGILTFLLQFRSGNHVTGQQLIDEANAGLVHQDGAVTTDTLGNQHGGCLLHGGMQLNLVNVHQISAHSLCHHNAVAGCTGGVGGDGAPQVGAVGAVHFLVGTEAAGGKNDGLCIDGQLLVRGLRLDTGSRAVHHNDFSGLGVQQHLDAQLLHCLGEAVHQIAAHAAAIGRGMDAGVGRTAGEGNLGQGSADFVQPVNGIGTLFRQGAHQVGVVDVVTALHGVLHELLHRIGNALLCLVMGLGSVHAAGGLGGVAAHIGHLFQQQHGLALLLGGDGCGHTGTAGTHNHHVHITGFLGLLCSLSRHLLHQGGSIHTGLCQCIAESITDGVAGHGSTCHAVHISRLGFQQLSGHLLHRHSAQAGGLAVAHNLHIGNLAAGQGHIHGDVTAEALGGCGVGAVGGILQRHGQCHIVGSRLGALHRCILKTSLCHGGLHSLLDGIAGDGSTGHAVHISRLGFHNLAGQLLNRLAANARGLVVAGEVDTHNLAVGNNQFCGHFAHAGSLAGVHGSIHHRGIANCRIVAVHHGRHFGSPLCHIVHRRLRSLQQTGSSHGFLHRILHGVGGDGGTCHAVHVSGLGFHNFGGHFFQHLAAQCGGLLGTGEGYVHNFAFGHGNFCLNLAEHTLGATGVHGSLRSFRCRVIQAYRTQQQRSADHQSSKPPYDFSRRDVCGAVCFLGHSSFSFLRYR